MGLLDTMYNVADVVTSDAGKQFAKGVASNLTGVDFPQTEENYDPAILEALRSVAGNALASGRTNIDYVDYPNLPDGTPMKDFVNSSKARGGFGNFFDQVAGNPFAIAAFTIGGGGIEVDDEDNVYLTDRYDFNKSNTTSESDLYSYARRAAGALMQGEGNTVRIYLGKKDEIMPEMVDVGNGFSPYGETLD